MEYVIHKEPTVILQDNTSTSSVLTEVLGTIKVEDSLTSVISQVKESTVVVNASSTEVILAGQLGPRGLTAEDMDVYSKRIDFISETELYKGEAAAGSSENSPVWRIRKIVLAIDNDVTETWASGTASFDKVWANRSALVYS
jgi:hypothetical protein